MCCVLLSCESTDKPKALLTDVHSTLYISICLSICLKEYPLSVLTVAGRHGTCWKEHALMIGRSRASGDPICENKHYGLGGPANCVTAEGGDPNCV